ncbi:lipase/esterase, putative [Talaromyces stipitatus ATCC 10500]|uniref:Lipase/esterase, putative n=1 Tax=Talaromyces stipitatus (strain ATCC 10500 / CBS 375.48 / QM 6759 / NRRL 1006) TaxID=441959 RepID=B8M023_TALSN|nr:lipase/esterase, putative [Talaromyces stipitatus ATCC 10500]EED20955.1 lipase/esterase, putative [Talaromyces stipitatus ATCC 10500]
MSDQQPLYISGRQLQRRRTVETSIDEAVQACHPRLRSALEEICQRPYEVTTKEQLQEYRDAATGYNAKSFLKEYHAQYAANLEHVEWSFERDGYIINLTIFRPSDDSPVGSRPCFYYIHGGGFVSGDPLSGMRTIIPLIHNHKALVATVKYRLAPEWKAPTQLEDCYYGLLEVWKERKALGINDRVLLVGRSAGANLAVGVALRVRDSQDEEKPRICGQMLYNPMLDHTSRMALKEFSYSPAHTQKNGKFFWSCYLGDEKESVTIYTVPYTAAVQDLVGLPRTLIDIAEVDCLSTEARDFGDRLKAAGNDVKINSWKGLFHCGDRTLQAQVGMGWGFLV